jgi:hypothetical protein
MSGLEKQSLIGSIKLNQENRRHLFGDSSVKKYQTKDLKQKQVHCITVQCRMKRKRRGGEKASTYYFGTHISSLLKKKQFKRIQSLNQRRSLGCCVTIAI